MEHKTAVQLCCSIVKRFEESKDEYENQFPYRKFVFLLFDKSGLDIEDDVCFFNFQKIGECRHKLIQNVRKSKKGKKGKKTEETEKGTNGMKSFMFFWNSDDIVQKSNSSFQDLIADNEFLRNFDENYKNICSKFNICQLMFKSTKDLQSFFDELNNTFDENEFLDFNQVLDNEHEIQIFSYEDYPSYEWQTDQSEKLNKRIKLIDNINIQLSAHGSECDSEYAVHNDNDDNFDNNSVNNDDDDEIMGNGVVIFDKALYDFIKEH